MTHEGEGRTRAGGAHEGGEAHGVGQRSGSSRRRRPTARRPRSRAAASVFVRHAPRPFPPPARLQCLSRRLRWRERRSWNRGGTPVDGTRCACGLRSTARPPALARPSLAGPHSDPCSRVRGRRGERVCERPRVPSPERSAMASVVGWVGTLCFWCARPPGHAGARCAASAGVAVRVRGVLECAARCAADWTISSSNMDGGCEWKLKKQVRAQHRAPS